jgi:hypothetical protein
MRWERWHRSKPLQALLGILLLGLAGAAAANAHDCRSLLQPTERKTPLNRMAMAAWMLRCLNTAGLPSAEAERLRREYASELVALQFRIDALDSHSTELEAQRFSTTTSLRGTTTLVVGGNAFFGTQDSSLTSAKATYGAGVVNYDQKLILKTSFTGEDLLKIHLRAGNFDSARDSFGGGGPSRLSELEVAFQEGRNPNLLGINRAYYQFPLGSNLRATLGGRVNQSVMLGLRPTVYPDDTVLDLFTQGGASGAYSSNLGVGAGLIWSQAGLRLSGQYIAGNGQNGSNSGGVFGASAGSSTTLQIGYQGPNWRLAAAAAWIENGFGIIDYGSPFVLSSYENPGLTSSYALSGTWQPQRTGWWPSISAGWGLNQTRYDPQVRSTGLVSTSQSWTLSLQWEDVLLQGNAMGGAIGQPIVATALVGGATPNDGSVVAEWWYQARITDAITMTPALFWLSRPLGADTPAGTALAQLGLLLKTTLNF